MKTPPIHNKQWISRLITTGLWLAAVLLLLWQAIPMVFGSGTMIPVDNLFQFAPYRAAAEDLGVTGHHIPLYSDLILQNYPWWQFIRQSFQDGQLPLWNPYIFSGTPFLVKGQHLALYPLSILFYFVPLERAYGLFIIIHFGLAAWTAAFLARTVGISRYGALLSGMIYGFSGFMLARAVFPMIIAAAVWLPLVLAMAERIILQYSYRGRPKVLLWILLGGIGLGMQALVGHPEILIYTLLTLVFYSLWRILACRMRQPETPATFSPLHALSSLGMMVMLGLLIGVVQLLPQYLVLQENFRKEAADFAQILGWSYPWQQVISLLVPNYFGNPARFDYTNLFTGLTETMTGSRCWGVKNFVEGAGYVGILPLMLALIGLRQRPSQHVSINLSCRPPSPLLFSVLTVLALCFVFGTPLYFLVYILPGMEQIHSPFRWMLVSTLGIAILAGYGIDRLRLSPGHAITVSRYFTTCGCILLIGLLLVRLFFEQTEPMVEAILRYSGGHGSVFPDMQTFFSYEAPWFVQLAFMLVISGMALHVTGRTAGAEYTVGGACPWKPLVALVIGADLLLFAHHLYPAADPALLRYTPDIIIKMQQDRTYWRFSTFDPESKKIFPANAGWLHSIQDIRGYDSIFSADYRRYMETIDNQDELLYNRIAPIRSPTALDSPLLDLLNVKYILSEKIIDNPRYLLAAHGDGLLLYNNTGALPRAFTLPLSSTVLAQDPFDAMRRYDPRFHMILPADDVETGDFRQDPLFKPNPGQPLAAGINSYLNNEVVISVTAGEPLWLVLADSYDSGWQAFAWPAGSPGQSVRLSVQRAYGTLRAVMLKEGDWVVRFSYRPISFIVGLLLSLAAGSLTIMGLLVVHWAAKKRSC